MNTDVAVTERKTLGDALERRNISHAQWATLANLYPGAKMESKMMVWDYCVARVLDPMKKPCHIVPMRVKDKDGKWGMRDVVMPGIYEYRTTAMRTGLYLGHSVPEYGPEIDFHGTKAPAYCSMTMYRWNKESHTRTEFPVCVWFRECAATTTRTIDGKDVIVCNDRWDRAPTQMLTKCTEAAGLREAFPDEIGGEPTADEMRGQTLELVTATPAKSGREATKAALGITKKPDPIAEEGSEVQRYILELRECGDLESLEELWKSIFADYEGKVPIDIEAVWHERTEMLEEMGPGS